MQGPFFHGSTPTRAARIRRDGFRATPETFLTDDPALAGDYGNEVITVALQDVPALELHTNDGPLLAQLEAIGLPFVAAGGYLSHRAIQALRDRGYQALIVSYPADTSDPSDPAPARRIARVLDHTLVQPIA